jgi:uncharacterized protein
MPIALYTRRHRVGRLSPPGPLCGAFFFLYARASTRADLSPGTMSMAFMRAASQLLLAALAAAECQRTPPEDFPARLQTSTAPLAAPQPTAPIDPPAHATANRCVLPTPPQPPASAPLAPTTLCPRDPESVVHAPAVVKLTFPDAAPGTALTAELVSTPRDTARGLMYRTSLAEDRGMLFDLRTREDHQFWMHNTCIPLDLLYLDGDGLVVGIVENAPTLNDDPRGVGCPSRYVLEVNAGWARRHGVKAGQFVPLPGS